MRRGRDAIRTTDSGRHLPCTFFGSRMASTSLDPGWSRRLRSTSRATIVVMFASSVSAWSLSLRHASGLLCARGADLPNGRLREMLCGWRGRRSVTPERIGLGAGCGVGSIATPIGRPAARSDNGPPDCLRGGSVTTAGRRHSATGSPPCPGNLGYCGAEYISALSDFTAQRSARTVSGHRRRPG